jgi:hypothetical protein
VFILCFPNHIPIYLFEDIKQKDFIGKLESQTQKGLELEIKGKLAHCNAGVGGAGRVSERAGGGGAGVQMTRINQVTLTTMLSSI